MNVQERRNGFDTAIGILVLLSPGSLGRLWLVRVVLGIDSFYDVRSSILSDIQTVECQECFCDGPRLRMLGESSSP